MLHTKDIRMAARKRQRGGMNSLVPTSTSTGIAAPTSVLGNLLSALTLTTPQTVPYLTPLPPTSTYNWDLPTPTAPEAAQPQQSPSPPKAYMPPTGTYRDLPTRTAPQSAQPQLSPSRPVTQSSNLPTPTVPAQVSGPFEKLQTFLRPYRPSATQTHVMQETQSQNVSERLSLVNSRIQSMLDAESLEVSEFLQLVEHIKNKDLAPYMSLNHIVTLGRIIEKMQISAIDPLYMKKHLESKIRGIVSSYLLKNQRDFSNRVNQISKRGKWIIPTGQSVLEQMNQAYEITRAVQIDPELELELYLAVQDINNPDYMESLLRSVIRERFIDLFNKFSDLPKKIHIINEPSYENPGTTSRMVLQPAIVPYILFFCSGIVIVESIEKTVSLTRKILKRLYKGKPPKGNITVLKSADGQSIELHADRKAPVIVPQEEAETLLRASMSENVLDIKLDPSKNGQIPPQLVTSKTLENTPLVSRSDFYSLADAPQIALHGSSFKKLP